MDFDAEMDLYPQTNKIYLDFLDVKYGQVQEETAAVARFIASAIEKSPATR